MRTARRQDPAPERPDPLGRVGELIGVHEALARRARRLLSSCPQEAESVDRLADEVILLARHTGELRADLEQYVLTAQSLAAAFEAGREHERAAVAVPSGPKHAAPGKRLRLVQGLPGVAAAAACLRHSWAVQHAPQLASGAAVVTLAASAALPPAVPVAQHHAPLARAAAPGWWTPATPLRIPEPLRASRSPRPAAASPRPLVAASPSSLLPVSAPVPVPVPVTPVAASPSVPPGVLAASDTVVDLQDGETSGQVVITAEGGPVRWAVAEVPGVDVAPGSGELQAGESAVLTVTATDLTDGGFAIIDLGGGVSLSVSWTAEAGLLGVARLL